VSFAAAAFDFVIAHQSSTWEIEIEIEIGKEAATMNETGAALPTPQSPTPKQFLAFRLFYP
jgi:hypothetical protein